MKTKHEEEIKNFTDLSNVQRTKYKFLAENVYRVWGEDFVDEDTGKVVNIERKEIVMRKGTPMTSENIQELSFFLNSGDVKEVLLSTQQRIGNFEEQGHTQLWEVVIINPFSKTEKAYLYAENLQMSIEIAKDYFEQKIEGGFSIKSIKPIGYAFYIEEEEKDNILEVEHTEEEKEIMKEEGVKEEETPTYIIETEYRYKDKDSEWWNTYRQDFIVLGDNTEDCKVQIKRYYEKNVNNFPEREKYEIRIITAKKIKVNAIVPLNFCMDYFKNKKDE